MFSTRSLLKYSHAVYFTTLTKPVALLLRDKSLLCNSTNVPSAPFTSTSNPSMEKKVPAPSHPASYWALPVMPEALCPPISSWFLPSTRNSTPPPTSPGGEWLGGLVWADTHCSLVAKPERWEAGSLHIPLPNTETFQRLKIILLL